MKIFVTGGTGFVGSKLVDMLAKQGHSILVLTRSAKADRVKPGVEFVVGDPLKPGLWQERVKEAEWIINLAGSTIARRWNEEIKRDIRESRIFTTKNLVDAIPNGSTTTLFSTSAVGYYGFHGDEPLYEDEPAGSDFLGQTAAEWEAEALKAKDKGARVVITRFGLVIGEKGGLLGYLVPLFKSFIGGPVGSGRQWFSWVHMEDLLNAFPFIFERKHISGPVNVSSPHPVTNAEFSKALGRALGVPAFVTTPGFAIKLVMGEFGTVLLNGQKVLPGVLGKEGFIFKHASIDDALKGVV